MDKRIFLAYLHVAHARAKTEIEASLIESHIDAITKQVARDDFLLHITNQIKDKQVSDLQEPDAIACLLACSYFVTDDDTCDTYAILITEVEYACKQTQSMLEEEIREKTWTLLKVMHPEQHAQYEKASKAMVGKAVLTVLKRRRLIDEVTQLTPTPPSNSIILHWIEDFLKALRTAPRGAKLVWEE